MPLHGSCTNADVAWGTGGHPKFEQKEVSVVPFYLVPLRVFECRKIPVPFSVFSQEKKI